MRSSSLRSYRSVDGYAGDGVTGRKGCRSFGGGFQKRRKIAGKRDSDQKSPLECRNSHRKRRETSRKVLGGSRVLIIPLSRRTSALIPYNIVHCQLLLAKGEVEQASAAFKIVLDGDHDNVPALLGQACVEFNRGRFSDSLELYKRVLQVYPNCPAAVRLGIGLCRYKLGQFEKAQQAFERVLQANPENVESLIALAIMDLRTNEATGIRTGMVKMQRAFEIYPYCAMALNYLANHFFFTGQHFLVEQLTETALAVTNHGPTKSHSYYNLARSYHSKGDYDKAGVYYMASVKEVNKPHEFVFPYYGLGQVQIKLGDFKSALSNFEKVLEVYPDNCETLKALGHIYVQLGQTDKGQDFIRKATKIDPRDAQAFLELGELLILSDTGAALDAFKTAHTLFKKGGQEVPIELLNNIGVLQFERGEFELARQTFKEALGDGVWLSFINEENKSSIDAATSTLQFKDMQLFHDLESNGHHVEVPWDKVTVLFNLARLLEQLYDSGTASIFYRLILFKYPDYIDAYLRLAAIAKARNNILLSIELVNDALKVNNKCPNALSMLGELELKNDDWVKAKETLRTASDATDGKDSYATLSLGNWNYFAAVRNEKRNPKLEATHLEKAKELCTRYQNCLRKFYHNTDSQILLYLARTHYEAEQWQDCIKTLLRAIHLAPSNYTLRFDAGVAMQKFSASTLQKAKRTADEMERRKQEDELKRVQKQEEHFRRVKEQWKSSSHSKRRERSDDEEGGTGEKKRKKGGKRRKKDKHSKLRYDAEEPEDDLMDEQGMEDEEADINYREEPQTQMNDDAEENAQGLLAAAGLEDSDADEETQARGSEYLHGYGVEQAARSMVVAENSSHDDGPCRAQNKLGDWLEEMTLTAQTFHKKGSVEDDDMAESNMVRVNQARDPAVDRGGFPNLVGITNSTSAETPKQIGPSPLSNKKKKTGAWLVYSRSRGCKKEVAQAAPSSSIARRRQALSESDDDEPLLQRQSSPVRQNSADMQLSDGEIRDGDKTNGDDGNDEEKQY
ncbi:hypothetical protein JHK85_043305 [Glycine max]|nr:hypothetical protein JHK85_043305 [Glycine max]